MRVAGSSWAGFALWVVSMLSPGRAEAQAVGFQPGIGTVPDGVSLNVTPVVSADRRYVRLGINANFSTINGFMNFPVARGVAEVMAERVPVGVPGLAAEPSATSWPGRISPTHGFRSAPNISKPAARPPRRRRPRRPNPSTEARSSWPTRSWCP